MYIASSPDNNAAPSSQQQPTSLHLALAMSLAAMTQPAAVNEDCKTYVVVL